MYNAFNYKQSPRLNDKYAQLYEELAGRIESEGSLTPTEEQYYNEWADTCLEPEPTPRLKQLYAQLSKGV